MPKSTVAAPDASVKSPPMTILELRAQNVMGLSAVRINAQGEPVIVVAGENEAGKSSVLNAIEIALRGKTAMPARPVRAGEDGAVVHLNMGDVIVTRTITPEGGGTLKVINRDGLAYPSPQAFLNGLLGELSFDPVAFATMDEDEQAATLRRLAKIDTTDLDAEHQKVYDERTLVNRDVKQATAALAKMPSFPDAGTDLVNTSDLAARLEAANREASAALRAEHAVEMAQAAVKVGRERARQANEEIDRLRAALEAAELASLDADAAVMKATDDLEAAETLAKDLAAGVPDRAGIQAELEAADATNAKVRANQERRTLAEQVVTKQDESDRLTKRLHQIELTKAELLANATFPVKGLGLDGTGTVTWNGLPFSQASTAIRIRASVAIGLALNPTLKVLLVRNGNDLGHKNLLLLADAAEAAGAQLWVERIAGGDGLATVLIEDGMVAAREAARV